MNQPLVSVIVPLYNSEKFVNNLIESIKTQRYSNWELILIDDNSTDSTYNLSYKYISSKIHLFRNNGKGVSAARNMGIKKANGDFIAFIDSDDRVDNLYLSSLVSDAIAHKTDITFQGYTEITAHNKKKVQFPWLGISDHEYIINKIIPTLVFPVKNEVCPMMPVWRTLIKRQIILENNLQFDPKIKSSEDFQFLLRLLFKCKQIFGSDEKHYSYFRRASSLMNIYDESLLEDSLYTYKVFINTLKENHVFNKLKRRYESNRFTMYSICISNIAKGNINRKEKIQLLKKVRNTLIKDDYLDISITKLYNPFVVKVGVFLLKMNMLSIDLWIYGLKERIRLNSLN